MYLEVRLMDKELKELKEREEELEREIQLGNTDKNIISELFKLKRDVARLEQMEKIKQMPSNKQ